MSATQITWRNVLEMPEDGNRYEAIGGVLNVTPPPKMLHQWASANLFAELYELLVKPGYGMLFHPPTGAEHPVTGEGVQPDLLFVSNERLHIVTRTGSAERPTWSSRSPQRALRDATAH
jgi:Uma2 family endonuclease